MITYVPNDYKTSRFILAELTPILVISVTALLYSIVIPGVNFTLPLVVLVALVLFRFVRVEKVKQVTFDEEKKLLTVFYTKFFRQRTEYLPFGEINIEVVRARSSGFFPYPMILYFLKGSIEYFEITRSKDGFTPETLEEIIAISRSLAIPIKEKGR